MNIIQITSTSRFDEETREFIETIYGLGDDNNMYEWDWAHGEWCSYQSNICQH